MAVKFFSVGDFAKFSRLTRATLHHYDKIGLLSPSSRGTNNYRYYSRRQLSLVNLIQTLQSLGLGLEEIKELRSQRTPAQMNDILMRLMGMIDNKMSIGLRARKLLLALQKSIYSVLNVDEKAITIQYLPQEPIILGDSNDYSNGRDEYDALTSFYHTINTRYSDLGLHYPVWGIFSAERITRGDQKWPDRYFFYHPIGSNQRPAALYTIGYQRGGYGQTDELYKRMTDYIDRQGFEICGDAYEEYPLNELCVSDDTNYLIRVMITVREKKQKP